MNQFEVLDNLTVQIQPLTKSFTTHIKDIRHLLSQKEVELIKLERANKAYYQASQLPFTLEINARVHKEKVGWVFDYKLDQYEMFKMSYKDQQVTFYENSTDTIIPYSDFKLLMKNANTFLTEMFKIMAKEEKNACN